MVKRRKTQTGDVIGGDFRIVSPLDAGGMGAVFVAEQLSTGALRALKLMHRHHRGDDKLRERFMLEALVSASVPSEHVVAVIAAGIDEGSEAPWLAMELLEGEDLAARMKRTGPLPLTEVRALLQQMCHGLAAAHDAGIVHRDLKPRNVFIARAREAGGSERVKLLDFGVAKRVVAGDDSTAAVGTPAWMSPEQSDRGHRIAPSADVWSLGLLTFWMLTGRSYWLSLRDDHGSMETLLREMLLDPLVVASARAAELGCTQAWPARLDGWFSRCVARAPDARFTDAAHAYLRFEATLGGVALEPSVVAPTLLSEPAWDTTQVDPLPPSHLPRPPAELPPSASLPPSTQTPHLAPLHASARSPVSPTTPPDLGATHTQPTPPDLGATHTQPTPSDLGATPTRVSLAREHGAPREEVGRRSWSRRRGAIVGASLTLAGALAVGAWWLTTAADVEAPRWLVDGPDPCRGKVKLCKPVSIARDAPLDLQEHVRLASEFAREVEPRARELHVFRVEELRDGKPVDHRAYLSSATFGAPRGEPRLLNVLVAHDHIVAVPNPAHGGLHAAIPPPTCTLESITKAAAAGGHPATEPFSLIYMEALGSPTYLVESRGGGSRIMIDAMCRRIHGAP